MIRVPAHHATDNPAGQIVNPPTPHGRLALCPLSGATVWTPPSRPDPVSDARWQQRQDAAIRRGATPQRDQSEDRDLTRLADALRRDGDES